VEIEIYSHPLVTGHHMLCNRSIVGAFLRRKPRASVAALGDRVEVNNIGGA
jgi:hypothetical protein